MTDPEKLLPFCNTDRQREIIEAVVRHGSQRIAATVLGISRGTVSRVVDAVKNRAALQGIGDHFVDSIVIPNPLAVFGTSTYTRDPESGRGQWVKAKVEDSRKLAAIEEWMERLSETIAPTAPVEAPERCDDRLMTVYPIGDPHFGLRAWAAEIGEGFDLAEADRRMRVSIDALVAASPPSRKGVLINLGDFFHANDSKARTPRSGHELDVSDQYGKIAMVGLDAMVYAVHRALERHAEVEVISLPGNHDPEAHVALAFGLMGYFAHNPRVTVKWDKKFQYLRWGSTIIGTTHGDGLKHESLPLIMAEDCREWWSEAKEGIWMVGHIHHKKRLAGEDLGRTRVESFCTLAGDDAFHHNAGYRSIKEAVSITFDLEGGEESRVIRKLRAL